MATSVRARRCRARFARSRNSSRSRISRPRRAYIKAGYLWNSGNFMFRAAVLLDEYRKFDAGSVAGGRRCRRQGRARSRLRHPRSRCVRRGQGDLDRLCGDGEDRARRRGAGVLRLVRCRLLACGVGIVGQGRAGQRRARHRRVRGFPQLQRRRPTTRWSRWKASTISSWWRRRTRCWCRGRRTPTG